MSCWSDSGGLTGGLSGLRLLLAHRRLERIEGSDGGILAVTELPV